MPGVTCPSCGHENTIGSRFCSSCGISLGPEQDTTTISFEAGESAEADVAETPVPEVEVDLSDVPLGTGVLVVTRGEAAGSRILLDLVTTTAGRHPKSDIFLDDITVSRRHAEIIREGDAYRVRDAGSLNGTYVNRERVEEAPLTHGDVLQVGKYKLHFLVAGVT
jgi:pSer/pThr/pTyr-binding forkhead associated (FHA) protein